MHLKRSLPSLQASDGAAPRSVLGDTLSLNPPNTEASGSAATLPASHPPTVPSATEAGATPTAASPQPTSVPPPHQESSAVAPAAVGASEGGLPSSIPRGADQAVLGTSPVAQVSQNESGEAKRQVLVPPPSSRLAGSHL